MFIRLENAYRWVGNLYNNNSNNNMYPAADSLQLIEPRNSAGDIKYKD